MSLFTRLWLPGTLAILILHEKNRRGGPTMAELTREGDDLVVVLSTAEKLEAAHGDVRVPISSVQGAEVVDDAVGAVPGIKVIGAGWPGKFAIGTYSSGPGHTKTFAVVHHDHPGGVLVRLAGDRFDQIVVSSADPEGMLAKLGELG
jgi:hypothetical protein